MAKLAVYNTKGKEGKVTETDAQLWMTTKAFRHMMFGFGNLNKAQALILDRIEAGEDIEAPPRDSQVGPRFVPVDAVEFL